MKKRKGYNRPSELAERLGWERCVRRATLGAAFAFGRFDGPAVVVARCPPLRKHKSVVVEFIHPKTQKAHQAVVMESEVVYE